MQLNATPTRRALQALRRENGFTMIAVMGVLFVVGILSVAAIAAANGDIHLSRSDQNDKQAYAAAEAGIDDYLAHLGQDPDYWTRCAGEAAPARPLGAGNAVNQQFTGTPPATRKWRDVPGADSRYSIELVPAPGKTACDVNDPIGSMIDGDGNFRIRSTGEVTGTRNKKAVVASFRRSGFLDYIYFTDLENKDPTYLDLTVPYPTQSTDASGTPDGGSDLRTWAGDKCERHWSGTQAQPGQGRGVTPAPTWTGKIVGAPPPYDGVLTLGTNFACGEITFADADAVKGPFHSNDDIQVNGTPEFGRSSKKDRVEVSGNVNSTGWRPTTANPVFNTPSGKLTTRARTLKLPPTNAALKARAAAGYLYSGPTTIKLNGATMDVTTGGATTNNVALPPNGVIYIRNTACAFGYKPGDTGSDEPGCGLVHVSGTYSKDLTISAEDDVIVDDNLTRVTGTNSVLGLIADKFIRVRHLVDRGASGCPNVAGGYVSNIKIEAAILSLKHSFTVDNFDCGATLGTLTVNGVIAQKHRGIVATGAPDHGYVKDYNYDDRLKYRSPPYFLDPVQAAWRVLRQNEQSPAR